MGASLVAGPAAGVPGLTDRDRWRRPMTMRLRALRLAAGLALAGGLLLPGAVTTLAHSDQSADAHLDHVFVIMLENHSQSSVIGDTNAPFITALASTYATADQYYGVTHPSEPNYIAAISGSNWAINNDDPANRYDHTNLVDQLEAHGITWAAYMESMPANDRLTDYWPASSNALYASKHDPFVLFTDIRNDPARMTHVKPFTSFAADMNSGHAPRFVWISPNQCHDMHGGVYSPVASDGSDGSPCPYGSTKDDPNDAALKAKADAFVKSTVETIMSSKAWTGNSAIFILTDENDYTGNASTDGWESAAGCCDSPILQSGYQFLKSDGITPDGNVWMCPTGQAACMYGGGLIPAIVVTKHGRRGYVSHTPYNHYSLLRTIEENWKLGYLGAASDSAQVQSMNALLVH
jgi:phosphatidylinositol-3-phosphatase